MRIKYELEYTLRCSPKVLFARLSTPEGLGEWFADTVTADGDLFNFSWRDSASEARLSALKENRLVRFEWPGMDDDETNFFEFKILLQELTGDVALVITDFSEPEEKDDAVFLWDSQVSELKRVLGG
ncbi:MAG: START-like domain-containing protein [Bacteroidales bacterium]|jgi:uncharacterized protein YndB with AHSA1/START domain|nr:START-like domain-containing protein [Bacteroidales bacterium]